MLRLFRRDQQPPESHYSSDTEQQSHCAALDEKEELRRRTHAVAEAVHYLEISRALADLDHVRKPDHAKGR
jgi:hypothetical protein